MKGFGAEKAVGSLEEALDNFVETETLDGANQYHCSRCDSKQDAEKGLEIVTVPYLLTVQLKRFDFDYTTMRRIKLNDRLVLAGGLASQWVAPVPCPFSHITSLLCPSSCKGSPFPLPGILESTWQKQKRVARARRRRNRQGKEKRRRRRKYPIAGYMSCFR